MSCGIFFCCGEESKTADDELKLDEIKKNDADSDEDTAPLDDGSSIGSTSTTPEDHTIFSPSIPKEQDEEALALPDSEKYTPLYQAIEDGNWNGTLVYLSTGRLDDDYVYGSSSDAANFEAEARRWVVSKDWWGKVLWRRLPLHAALLKHAPTAVIQKLVEVYPGSVVCTDNDGNLPVHLAFMNGTSDSVIAFLLNAYPESVNARNKDNKLPVQYANSSAGEIIQLCVDQTNEAAKKEEAKLYQALESEKTRLSEILKQLSEIRNELDDIKGANEKSSYFKGLAVKSDNKANAEGDDVKSKNKKKSVAKNDAKNSKTSKTEKTSKKEKTSSKKEKVKTKDEGISVVDEDIKKIKTDLFDGKVKEWDNENENGTKESSKVGNKKFGIFKKKK